MSRLPLNDAGIPEPGRELDAWIWVNILGNEPIDWSPDKWDRKCPYCGGYVSGPDNGHLAWCKFCGKYRDSAYQAYSTTHAYHQVMEADTNLVWSFHEFIRYAEGSNLSGLQAAMYSLSRGTGLVTKVEVKWADYPNREAAWAYGVCAVAWLAKGGEDGLYQEDGF